MEPLEVLLFGGFALRRGQDTVPPIPSRAGRSLFAYLVVNRGVLQARERLVAELWPELPEARGRRRLSHTLWQLQDALGELPDGARYLEVSTDSLGFAPDAPVTVDVETFERGLSALRRHGRRNEVSARELTRLEQAVELYRGEFLDGHYDAWIRAEQERLGQCHHEALSLLSGLAKRHGAYDKALVYARRLTHQDPLREDGHREVMRLSMLLERPEDALRQYERCVEVLADELGTGPSPATMQLRQRVLRHQQVGPSGEPARTADPFPERTPLVGRDQERGAALSVLETGLGGRGGTVFIEGDPGVGKTRLLTEVAEDARWRGYTVLRASCGGHATAGAFGAVRSLLLEALTPLRIEHLRHRVEPVWMAQVAQLVPLVGRVLPRPASPTPNLRRAEGAQRMRDALVRVLLALSEIDPTLVVIDDVQGADDGSLDVLASLSGQLDRHRFALFIGYRADEARARPAVWEAVERIDRGCRPLRLLLSPLDPRAIGELVRVVARGHRIDPAAISRLQRETGGNPLFVVETLRELAQDDELAGLASDDPSNLPLPGSIRELVRSRLQRLPTGVRAVLEAAAVAGDGTDLDTLATATELPRHSVVEAVDLLVRRSFVREGETSFSLHHEQVRRASLEVIALETRRALHLRIGAALEEHHPDQVERLAHHFEAGGNRRRAVDYLRAAARNAAALHAYATADGFYRRAITQQRGAPSSLTARFELLAEHESVLDVLGERDRQRAVIEEMDRAAGSDRTSRAEVCARRALLEAELGELATALELADRAVALSGTAADAELRWRCVQAAATVRTWLGRREEAVALWERARGLAPDAASAAESRTMLASVLRELHRYEPAAAELADALDVAGTAGELREQARALGVLGSVRMELGDDGEAVDLYRRSLRTCEEIGFRRGELVNLVNLANVLYVRDEVGPALGAYRRAAVLATSLADLRMASLVRMNLGYVSYAVLADAESARAALDAALAFFVEAGDPRFEAGCSEILARIELGEGDHAAAERWIDRGLAAVAGAGDPEVLVRLQQRAAELALARDDTDGALARLEAAAVIVEEHGAVAVGREVQAQLGRTHLQRDEPEAALAATGRAVDGIDRGIDRGYLVRLAHHDALCALGRDDEARAHARQGAAQLRALLESLDDHDRQQAVDVADHARLLQVAGESMPPTVSAWVAAHDAPRGRPLRNAERIEVRLHVPRSAGPADPVEHRRWVLRDVVDQVRGQGGRPTVGDLAAILEVSEATVRRDLAVLRTQGEEVPTRGARAG